MFALVSAAAANAIVFAGASRLLRRHRSISWPTLFRFGLLPGATTFYLPKIDDATTKE